MAISIQRCVLSNSNQGPKSAHRIALVIGHNKVARIAISWQIQLCAAERRPRRTCAWRVFRLNRTVAEGRGACRYKTNSWIAAQPNLRRLAQRSAWRISGRRATYACALIPAADISRSVGRQHQNLRFRVGSLCYAKQASLSLKGSEEA